uniref:Cornifelin-like n=1 Tax=Scophthalmus maximus TaxID=52904 RepID=A0A8D3BGG7_SCOMX
MAHPLTEWNSDLCACCEDARYCCYGFWCCSCIACAVSEKFGEHRCLPILDICSPAITACCGCPCCVAPAALALRVGIRHRYGIQGSLCKDIAVSCFCEWCAWCQMHRELKYRMNNHTVVVNMQPTPVKLSHAAPLNAARTGPHGFVVASY